jgi:hypothetical protein
MERVEAFVARLRGKQKPDLSATDASARADVPVRKKPSGTFINKLDPNWLRLNVGMQMDYELYPWRSVSVRFLRAVIHDATGGRLWLRLLFWLEERFPRFFAEKGQYPMVIIRK